MTGLIECVPNFSEGRDAAVVEMIRSAILRVPTSCVLDTHIDADHNRSVITFVAHADHVVEAAFSAVKQAAELIDLRKHIGEHPRLGATDVLPFVPIKNATMEDCVRLAHEAGKRIAAELAIPVYFYERAALREDRVNLEDVRRGAFELLRDQITTVTSRIPDEGAARIHESAGAIIIGARPFLIAFNCVLASDDLAAAKQIAKAIRARSGGLPFLKALGFKLASRNRVQVSMNLLNYRVTGMREAYEAVRREAEKVGIEVESAEIVGLVPQDALNESEEYFQKLDESSRLKILENQLARCGPFEA
ncbi:MAG TPA: glutamate formimidoyltransferase [Pyrinomonadaceae bacterium]|nr:glutamate formimidoyltransferase [Pyrinomonadaceae bacterium]